MDYLIIAIGIDSIDRNRSRDYSLMSYKEALAIAEALSVKCIKMRTIEFVLFVIALICSIMTVIFFGMETEEYVPPMNAIYPLALAGWVFVASLSFGKLRLRLAREITKIRVHHKP